MSSINSTNSINSIKVVNLGEHPAQPIKGSRGKPNRTRFKIVGLDDDKYAIAYKEVNNFTEEPKIKNPITKRNWVALRVTIEDAEGVAQTRWFLVNQGSLRKRLGIDKTALKDAIKGNTIYDIITSRSEALSEQLEEKNFISSIKKPLKKLKQAIETFRIAMNSIDTAKDEELEEAEALTRLRQGLKNNAVRLEESPNYDKHEKVGELVGEIDDLAEILRLNLEEEGRIGEEKLEEIKNANNRILQMIKNMNDIVEPQSLTRKGRIY